MSSKSWLTASIFAAVAGVSAIGASSAMANPGGPGFGPVGSVLLRASVHTALALDATQEAAWQQLRADSQTLEDNLETLHENTAALVAAELAKTAPDLSVIVSLENSARAAADALVRAFQQQELAFYATLTATQQATVIAAIRNRATLGAGGHHGR